MYTKFYYHVRRRCSWHIPVILIACFFISARAAAQNVQAIEVRDTGFFEPGFYRAFYIDDYVVYQSQIHTSSSQITSHIDSATSEIIFDDSLISTGSNSSYFVFHRDSCFGYSFRPGKMFLPPRVAVETESKAITGTNEFENLLSQKPDSAFLSADSAERWEVFLSPEKPDTPAIRIAFSYSGKLNHLNHSLNRTIDAEKKMKLRKVEIIIAAFYDPKSKTNFPQLSFVTEMVELPPVLPKEILLFLNWYKDIVQLSVKSS